MAKAIFAYFQKIRPTIDQSASSMDDLKFEDAAPIIKKTWGELMKEKVNVGAKIYDYILTKEISMSRLFMSTNIEKQGGIFMMMMDRVVGFLDDPLTMDENIQELGKVHVDKYGVKTKHFKHFRAAFLKAIKKYLPWTERREQAWQWFWTRIINQMSHATQANHYPLINKFDGRELSTEEMIENGHYIHSTFDTALRTDPKAFADKFYKSLLDEQPDIAQLFTNTTFERQSTRFIAMLQHAIKLLDDTNSFTVKLESLSAQHVDYGVQIPMLESFGNALILQVKQLNIKQYDLLHDKMDVDKDDDNDDNKEKEDEQDRLFELEEWSQKHDDAWRWFWKVVVGVFSEGMNKYVQEMQQQKKEDANKNKEEIVNEDFSAI